jgi:hypothetical protein
MRRLPETKGEIARHHQDFSGQYLRHLATGASPRYPKHHTGGTYKYGNRR